MFDKEHKTDRQYSQFVFIVVLFLMTIELPLKQQSRLLYKEHIQVIVNITTNSTQTNITIRTSLSRLYIVGLNIDSPEKNQ